MKSPAPTVRSIARTLGISHTTVSDALRGKGRVDPATHGFVSLNVVYQTRPCAGLDQQPRELGGRAVELIIAQLHRNQLGVPAWPTTTTIAARWVEGPTVRRLDGAPRPVAG